LGKERIAPQLSNVLADWVRGKWGLGIKEKKGLNAEFAEETQRALRREEKRLEEKRLEDKNGPPRSAGPTHAGKEGGLLVAGRPFAS
jgi:hypothetical protein